MKLNERSKRRKKEEPKVDSNDSKEIDPVELFMSSEVRRIGAKYKTLYDEEDDSPFIKLLLAINMRASSLPLQSQFPKMDLSALYCLGITIQEYARHLSTNIMTQKLASENAPQLNTLFSQEELEARSLTSVIENYKQRKPVKSVTSAVVNPRPDIREEVSSHARSMKYRQGDPFNVDTVHGDTFYQKMLRTTDWENVLRKNNDPEAAAAAAEVRRANDAKRQAKKAQKLIKKAEKQQSQKIIPSSIPVKTDYLPLSPPADIFDRTSNPKSKKKASSSSSSQKKRKRAPGRFF